MKRKTLLLSGLIILLLIIFAGWKFFGPTVHQPEKKYFYVASGSDYASLRKALIDSAVIGGGTWFDWTSRILKFESVRPGKYEINKGMSLFNLVRVLKNGKQSPVNFVITKIRTKEVLAARIANAFECDSTTVINFLNNPDSLREFGLDTNTAMVVAMPLIYTLKWNNSISTIFRSFHTAYSSFWTEERRQKATQLGLKPVEVSTLASIIDEETNSAIDKPKVASVYLNRLSKGTPLQADPTVKFAMRNFSLHRIYSDYTKLNSPYNTYENKGLPPGPICTPAMSTIDSVLNSPKTDYIYFVASPRFDGSHDFTTNYADHIKLAKIYQAELYKRNIH